MHKDNCNLPSDTVNSVGSLLAMLGRMSHLKAEAGSTFAIATANLTFPILLGSGSPMEQEVVVLASDR